MTNKISKVVVFTASIILVLLAFILGFIPCFMLVVGLVGLRWSNRETDKEDNWWKIWE